MLELFGRRIRGCFLVIVAASVGQSTCLAGDYWLADGKGWPGKVFSVDNSRPVTHWQRSAQGDDRVVPRVQSLTFLQDGSLVFCSGLDRSLFILGQEGERELHYGGGLVRQVRTDTNGDLYWSGLETPVGGNPLPDGYIYRKRADNQQVETLLTFSQELVQRDWWGAFDVRDGQVYVSTLNLPSRIYQLENSIPRLVATLPISAKSFRFESPSSILATDGSGKLYRLVDLSRPETLEVVSDGSIQFVDFARKPHKGSIQ